MSEFSHTGRLGRGVARAEDQDPARLEDALPGRAHDAQNQRTHSGLREDQAAAALAALTDGQLVSAVAPAA